MKAVVYTKYGPPEVLQLKDVAVPAPRDDEVLVQVHSASVNSWDWDLVRGKPFYARLGALRKPKYPILGADIAGRVEAVGRNATLFRPGDAVFGDISGSGWGGFAEYVCAQEDVLASKPDGISFARAAAMPQAGVLALQGLRNFGSVQPGQKVLINGAGGGVGTFAVQLAREFGAEVTGVDSAAKLDMLRTIGADHVIDYRQVDFTQMGEHYDLIIDVVASRSTSDYQRALGPQGACVIVGGTGAALLKNFIAGQRISSTSGQKIGLLFHKPNRHDLDELAQFVESGKVTPIIDRIYPLREVPEALRYLGTGQARGKLVIAVDHAGVA